jgi:hypothetical protein
VETHCSWSHQRFACWRVRQTQMFFRCRPDWITEQSSRRSVRQYSSRVPPRATFHTTWSPKLRSEYCGPRHRPDATLVGFPIACSMREIAAVEVVAGSVQRLGTRLSARRKVRSSLGRDCGQPCWTKCCTTPSASVIQRMNVGFTVYSAVEGCRRVLGQIRV